MRKVTFILITLLALSGSSFAGKFTRNGTQPNLDYPLINSNGCRYCHSDFGSDAISPWSTWSGSMMANAGRDPLFWAALDVANNDIEGIGDWCLRCHAPAAWLAGRSEPPNGSEDGCSLQGGIDQSGGDFDGVTCHLCHRMMENPDPPQGQQSFYTENGQWWIDDEPCEGNFEPCRRGPYDYDADGSAPAPHAWKYSSLHESSDLCATCHNVTHPEKNLIIDGRDTGVPFPIERTSREWERSAFADKNSGAYQTCQNCHMPDSTNDPSFACIFQINNRTRNMPMHQLVGGNTWIPRVLRGEYPNLGLEQQLTATEQLARQMLQQRTAEVQLSVQPPLTPDDPIQAKVRVINLAGHKLPTGYHEGRRLWLHVQAIDATGTTVWENGGYDELTGDLDIDESTKVYEAIQGEWNPDSGKCETKDEQGRKQFHFALNDCIVKDNRIPPLGASAKPDVETESVGYSYPLTADGKSYVNYDVTPYEIEVPADAQSPIQVIATLRFQTVSKEYVEFLRNEAIENDFPDDCIQQSGGRPEMSRGEILFDMWERYDKSPPEVVGSAAQSVVVNRSRGRKPGGRAASSPGAGTPALQRSSATDDTVRGLGQSADPNGR